MKLNCTDDDGSGLYDDDTACDISCSVGFTLKPGLISRTVCSQGRWGNLDVVNCVKDAEPQQDCCPCTVSTTTEPRKSWEFVHYASSSLRLPFSSCFDFFLSSNKPNNEDTVCEQLNFSCDQVDG
jgi:hypothetical protein